MTITVTGLTAAKMQEIVDLTVSGASVNGSGELILQLTGGGTVNAGFVIGPTGDTGPAGDVSLATMQAADQAVLDTPVTTDRLANLAVTEGKLASNAVTAAKISNNAVTSTKVNFIFRQSATPTGIVGGIWFET